MALIKVIGTDGKMKLVPKSFYESSLKKMGYKKYEVKAEEIKDNEEENKESEEGMESEENYDIESIPIGEMSAKQIKEYAALKGIDVSAAKSTKEAKDIVRKWMNEESE